MSETFRQLLETLDGELAANAARRQQAVQECERLTAARNALVGTPVKSVTPRRPVRPTRNPNPGIPESIRDALRAHPGHPADVVVRMVAEARGMSKNQKAIKRIDAALAEMIGSNAVHKAPGGELSLPAQPD